MQTPPIAQTAAQRFKDATVSCQRFEKNPENLIHNIVFIFDIF